MPTLPKRREPGTITPGMWVIHNGRLGIAFKNPALIPTEVMREVDVPTADGNGTRKEKRKVIERVPDPSKTEVHYVARNGDTVETAIVSLSAVRQAKLSEIKHLDRVKGLTLARAYDLGYDDSPEGKKASERAAAEREEEAAKLTASAKVEFTAAKKTARR